jgi:hypothetical protein
VGSASRGGGGAIALVVVVDAVRGGVVDVTCEQRRTHRHPQYSRDTSIRS